MWRKPASFATSDAGAAIDLICRLYPGAGTPSMYLRRVKLVDAALDIALAEHWRLQRAREIEEGLEQNLRRVGKQPEPRHEVLLRWLMRATFSK